MNIFLNPMFLRIDDSVLAVGIRTLPLFHIIKERRKKAQWFIVRYAQA